MAEPHYASPTSLRASLPPSLRIANHVVSERLGNETVLLNLQNGVYYGANPVGTRIWELLKAGESWKAISEHLAQEFEVEPQRLQDDLVDFIRTLDQQGLLEDA